MRRRCAQHLLLQSWIADLLVPVSLIAPADMPPLLLRDPSFICHRDQAAHLLPSVSPCSPPAQQSRSCLPTRSRDTLACAPSQRGGNLSRDEVHVIQHALDMTSKTGLSPGAMTPLDKVSWLRARTPQFTLTVTCSQLKVRMLQTRWRLSMPPGLYHWRRGIGRAMALSQLVLDICQLTCWVIRGWRDRPHAVIESPSHAPPACAQQHQCLTPAWQVFMLSADVRLDEDMLIRIVNAEHTRVPVYEGER